MARHSHPADSGGFMATDRRFIGLMSKYSLLTVVAELGSLILFVAISFRIPAKNDGTDFFWCLFWGTSLLMWNCAANSAGISFFSLSLSLTSQNIFF